MAELRRALVTGASGFIGCNLTRALAGAGVEVAILASPRFQPDRLADVLPRCRVFTSADEAIASARPGAVFHLASTPLHAPGVDASAQLRVTVGGALDLLEALKAHPARLVVTGSGAEYGAGSGFTEASPLEPGTLLGALKASASLLGRVYSRVEALPVTVLRLFTPYGPWDHARRLIPSVIRSGLRGESVQLHGDGSQRRDFLHIDDVVQALLAAGRSDGAGFEVYNISSGRSLSVRDTTALILSLMGNPSRISASALPPREADIAECSGNNTKAAESLGWRPSTGIIDGLESTIRWYKENPQWLRA